MRPRIAAVFVCILTLGSVASSQTPVVGPGGIENAAGLGNTTTIAPGSLISIFGTNLASGLSIASSATLSTALGDVDSVMINGMAAPLQFVAGGQINAQAPWELGPGQATVVVTRAGVASAPVAVTVGSYSPALYGFGVGAQAISINLDGTFTAPPGLIPGAASHPASAGDTLVFYASGLGAVDQPPPPDGAPSSDATRRTSAPLTVMMGGVPAVVNFAGLSPQFSGVYQVNVVVPAGVSSGSAVPVQLQIGGVTSADTLTIALQ
jgi:uncharacterized protein (TIGR03437 family)